MRTWLRRLLVLCVVLGVLIGVMGGILWWRYGGGSSGFPNRNTPPALGPDALELVASLPGPPGNIAVSPSGRIFFSFHPEGFPSVKVAELVDGKAVAYPSAEYQSSRSDLPYFASVLSLRIDLQGRLWTLDNAHHGVGKPRLLAFDLNRDVLVDQYNFDSRCAPIGSHLNDFQVAPDGKFIYIAEASVFGKTPALLVYDVELRRCRRLLDSAPPVMPGPFVPLVEGRQMSIFGVFDIQPGIDSITLDAQGEWLYFAALTADQMYKVRTADLQNTALSPSQLQQAVQAVGPKTMSDGISIDVEGNLYLTDLEHDSIVQMSPTGALKTLLQDKRLRWPDGLSFGPDGWLYVTCSSLQHVIGRLPWQVREHGPYQIFRFQPGPQGVPGH